MANKGSIAALIADINDKIKRNLQQAITGPRLNGVLNDTVDTLDALKQDDIEDLAVIRQGAEKGATAYQKPAGGIPASDIAEGVIPDVSQFITKSVNDLVNYYLKSETYTRAEVQAIIATVRQFVYRSVAELPAASEDTMHIIYLVPSADPQTQNIKDEYITLDNGEDAEVRYTWEQIGSTAIDLSGYVTTDALNTALAAYTTTADLSTLLNAKEDKTNKISDISVNRESTEKYPNAKAVYDAYFKRGVVSQTQTWTQAADGGYDYVMSSLVWGDIPKANIDLYEAAGAVFNATSGYFELNGLTDISYEEMKIIYDKTQPLVNRFIYTFGLSDQRLRTNFPLIQGTYYTLFGNEQTNDILLSGMASNSNIERLVFYISNNPINLKDYSNIPTLGYAFRNCTKLREIIGIINVLKTTSFIGAFNNCSSLETVLLNHLKASVSIPSSSRLSVASILYMINNEEATRAITITLHATAYARATADADITAALQNHPNVSLASA